MGKIHNTSIVSDKSIIHKNAKIGPYCIIGPNVEIADGVFLHSHVNIQGHTYIGEDTEIFPFSSIGTEPQDLKFNGEKSYVVIGKRNKIREYVSINRGTLLGNSKTTIGNDCLIMISSHIAHDCTVGDNVIMANNATLGGHVEVEKNVIIGGLAAIHQHVKIGKFSIIGGVSAVVQDIPPFANVAGDRGKILGINIVGMKRNNFSKTSITNIQKAYELIFKDNKKLLSEKIAKASEDINDTEVNYLIKFLSADSKRGICKTKFIN